MRMGFETVTTESALHGEPGTSSAKVRTSDEDGPEPRPRIKSPALFLALAFALGIASEGRAHDSISDLSSSIPALIALSGACLLAGAILVRARREVFATFLTLAGFVLAGAASAALFSLRFPPNHLSNLESWGIDANRPMNLEGIVLS